MLKDSWFRVFEPKLWMRRMLKDSWFRVFEPKLWMRRMLFLSILLGVTLTYVFSLGLIFRMTTPENKYVCDKDIYINKDNGISLTKETMEEEINFLIALGLQDVYGKGADYTKLLGKTLLDKQIILKEVKDSIVIEDKVVDEVYSDIHKLLQGNTPNFLGMQEDLIKLKLRRYGTDEATIKKHLKEDLIVSKFTEKSSATQEEIQAYFNDHKYLFKSVNTTMIWIPKGEDSKNIGVATEIIKQLQTTDNSVEDIIASQKLEGITTDTGSIPVYEILLNEDFKVLPTEEIEPELYFLLNANKEVYPNELDYGDKFCVLKANGVTALDKLDTNATSIVSNILLAQKDEQIMADLYKKYNVMELD